MIDTHSANRKDNDSDGGVISDDDGDDGGDIWWWLKAHAYNAILQMLYVPMKNFSFVTVIQSSQ